MHRKDRSPSQRFRFEQYIDFLKENGYDYDFSFLITPEDDKIFYSPGNQLKKGLIVLKCFFTRLKDVLKVKQYDLIFIQREAFMTGTTFFEKQFAKSRAKVVFDFDDSIWMQNVSDANKKFSFLKDASKTSNIIALSDMIFAGNQYLADYAKPFNSNIRIVPTTIDTDEYQRMALPIDEKVCIGWSGSITTIQHFKFAVPALQKIKKKYGDRIKIKVIGDANYRNDELDVISLNWNKQDELKELSSFDIGIMPLPDDEWAKGKCGLKGLQYMALEIPTIMSPVGVNSEIIQSGVNGFLAVSDDDYVNALSTLIDDEILRKKIGAEGRRTVVEKYSVKAWQQKYLQYFNELTNA
jgi:glycosyltransferase involved in cell wall biosynthesis